MKSHRITLRASFFLCKWMYGSGVVTSLFSNSRGPIALLGKAWSYYFLIMFTLHIPRSSSNTRMKATMPSFSCIEELTFFLNLEWNCTFVHCPEIAPPHRMGCFFGGSLCITYLPNPHQVFVQWLRCTGLGERSSKNPFPSDIQQTNGLLKHCLFLGSFCPRVLALLLPAESHCCGLLLLWDVIATVLVCCLAYWSSCCPAFLAKWYRVSWRGKTSSGNLILQRGRSPSSPLDSEYHLLILSSRGLSGQKPLFTPREGRMELWVVTIYGSESSESTGEVKARLQVLCSYCCATSPSVWVLKKAFKSF